MRSNGNCNSAWRTTSISASKRRYTAALMRTIFLGKPKDEWLRVAAACIGAVYAAMSTIKPGVTPHDADRAARAVTEAAGFGGYHRNRLGYSIGVSYPPDWGEGEILSLRADEHRPLMPGMTFHMPPLCLKYREFGIGFSESIVVTSTATAQSSSEVTKSVTVVESDEIAEREAALHQRFRDHVRKIAHEASNPLTVIKSRLDMLGQALRA